MSKHDAATARREMARKIERSQQAAKLLPRAGMRVRLKVAEGVNLICQTAGRPLQCNDGVWRIQLTGLPREMGHTHQCQAVEVCEAESGVAA